MVKRKSNSVNRIASFLYVAVLLCGTYSSYALANDDPLESVNRVTHGFNDVLDKLLLKPVSKTYQFLMPEFAERGVRNVFSNLGEVRNVVHNGLQGKGEGVTRSTSRFLINTTVGIGGLFDVATKIGIPLEREDLGQTLGKWGVGPGPYLVVPFFGPSSLRDSFGIIGDPMLSPLTHAPVESGYKMGASLLSAVQTRADLLSAEGLLKGDSYIIYRQAYLSKREFDVNDGIIKTDDFLENNTGFDENEEFLDEGF
jgi:phospholipid-binding lipoprotein MlaA